MDAKSSAGVPLSSPAAAQRCAEGAGLDSGAPAAAQSAMPSIAPLPPADRRSLSANAAAPAGSQLQSRIYTSLTDVTRQAGAPNTGLWVFGRVRSSARSRRTAVTTRTGLFGRRWQR